MAILAPSYCEDQLYASYRDRLLIKSLGIVAGMVGTEDYKISAGSGLQVNVKAGNAFVEQTNAIEESENSFYNGMYQVSNPTQINPFNSVAISSANPQIAQIILRVYDVGELKISGSSYGRVEWLNGTPTASATEAKMKEEVFEGVAALPVSSYRIARILVPKNATTSAEYYIEDARTSCYAENGTKLSLSTSLEPVASYYTPYIRLENGNAISRFKGLISVGSGKELKNGNNILISTSTLLAKFVPTKSVKLLTTSNVNGNSTGSIYVSSNGEMLWDGTTLSAGAEIALDGLTYSMK